MKTSQNHLVPSITDNRQYKAKCLTRNSIHLKFVKTTSICLSKALDISIATATVAPDLLKTLEILSDKTIRRSAVDQEDLKSHWESEKNTKFLKMINRPIIYNFFKAFINHKKKTNRTVAFSHRLFPNNLKYCDHRWDLSTV